MKTATCKMLIESPESTRKMLSEIEAAHYWDLGLTSGGGSTLLSRSDSCRVCGMNRNWFDDLQNGQVIVEGRVTFSDYGGDPFTIREASSYPCED